MRTAGRADDVGRGRDARYGQGQAAGDPAGRVEPAQRDRGVLRLRERGRGDVHRQDGRRGGTPSKIRQLYTKHSIRRESDACGPDGETGLRPDTVT